MVNLTRASRELFKRTPDERFSTFDGLVSHCQQQRELSMEQWLLTDVVKTQPALHHDLVELKLDDSEKGKSLSDWSFGQLCKLCGVSKDTVNKVSSVTANAIFQDTMPQQRRPWQIYSVADRVLSIHGTAYTRLYNAEVLNVVRDTATDFSPPDVGLNGGTGMYCGEQDMFCFLIDERQAVEIEGENFFPGLFVWNSEVGRRTVGCQTFWYQQVCGNHIVWDAVEVVELARKHTKNVGDSLDEIRRLIDGLALKRDQRRDGFAKHIALAMKTKLAERPEEVLPALLNAGLSKGLAAKAIAAVPDGKDYTVFALVDSLTRISGQQQYAAERLAIDVKAARLLSLAV